MGHSHRYEAAIDDKHHHIVRSFADELQAMRAKVVALGQLVCTQLDDATQALAKEDESLAGEVIAKDELVNQAERDIEMMVVRLIALRQPVAADLREAITAIKIVTDVERIGDLGKGIAKRVLAIKQASMVSSPSLVSLGDGVILASLVDMSKEARNQLKSVMEAYEEASEEKALEVWRLDDKIDRAYDAIFRQLMTYMIEDPRLISMCAHSMFIAKNIEREGDHVTNIAEMISYLKTGIFCAELWKKKDSSGRG